MKTRRWRRRGWQWDTGNVRRGGRINRELNPVTAQFEYLPVAWSTTWVTTPPTVCKSLQCAKRAVTRWLNSRRPRRKR